MIQTRNLLARLADLVATLQSAVVAANAVRNGRNPAADDLLQLGIDPLAFARIGRN